jgi:hypothetical protein
MSHGEQVVLGHSQCLEHGDTGLLVEFCVFQAENILSEVVSVLNRLKPAKLTSQS